MVQPFGPHHALSWSASVHAFQVRESGASKTRVMTKAASVAVATLLAGIFPSFPFPCLSRFEMSIEAIEAFLPQMAVGSDPLRDQSELTRLQPARPRLGRAAARDQPRPLQHLQMLGDRRLGEVEGRGQVV